MDHIKLTERKFASFCIKTIQNAQKDFLRACKRNAKHNPPAQPIQDLECDLFAEDDVINIRYTFNIEKLNNSVQVKDDTLAEALRLLPKNLCDIILMHFFLGMTDTDISNVFGVSRQRISFQRKKALKKLLNFIITGEENGR